MPPQSKSSGDLNKHSVTKRQLPNTDNLTSSFVMNQNANYQSRIKLNGSAVSADGAAAVAQNNSNQNNVATPTSASALPTPPTQQQQQQPKKSSKSKEKAISHEEFKGNFAKLALDFDPPISPSRPSTSRLRRWSHRSFTHDQEDRRRFNGTCVRRNWETVETNGRSKKNEPEETTASWVTLQWGKMLLQLLMIRILIKMLIRWW